MATLRLRFSGLCFFYREHGGLIVVRVLNPMKHDAELWCDPTTAMVETNRKGTKGEVCTLEGMGLNPVPRRVNKYGLDGKENITFANGKGDGPKTLPGVASLSRFNDKKGMKDGKQADFAASFTLNKGGWDSQKASLGVEWWKWENNQKKPGAKGPVKLSLWTDLIVASDANVFELTSTTTEGGWKFTPYTKTGEVRLWVGAAFDSDTDGEHFIHHFDQLNNAPKVPEWPELEKELPKCQGIGARANPGTTFCPDSQYP